MAKYNNDRYQLGPYYLGKRTGSPAWHRMWVENGQRLRVSLGTTDYEEAKRILNAWWVENLKLEPESKPLGEVLLIDVLRDYQSTHGRHLVDHRIGRIAITHWQEFWGDKATLANVRNLARQEEFHRHLLRKGLKAGTATRYIEIGRTAIRRAWKRGIISTLPFVEVPKRDYGEPKGRPLTLEEIGKLMRAFQRPHLRLMAVLMLATGARPAAVLELDWKQLDFVNGLIDLNPMGRVQTKKLRPVVKMPSALHMLEPGEGRVIQFQGKAIESARNGFRDAVKRAGLEGKVSAYSLRHSVARYMRQQGVPLEQVAAQLGHTSRQYSITLRYAPDDPDYLNEAVKALDRLLALVLPATGQLQASDGKSIQNAAA